MKVECRKNINWAYIITYAEILRKTQVENLAVQQKVFCLLIMPKDCNSFIVTEYLLQYFFKKFRNNYTNKIAHHNDLYQNKQIFMQKFKLPGSL